PASRPRRPARPARRPGRGGTTRRARRRRSARRGRGRRRPPRSAATRSSGPSAGCASRSRRPRSAAGACDGRSARTSRPRTYTPVLLLVDRPADGVARLTLNRPEKRNALSLDLRAELAQALEELAADENTRCLLITGTGTAFCAGMDVTQFGGGRANKERIVATSTRLFDALA